MTYLFSSNVEVSNDIGNALPITVTNTNGNIVSIDNPFPVTLGSESITIVGNISIPTTVNVASSSDDPVHTHITEIGTSGNLLALGIDYMPVGGNVIVTGNVGIVGNVTVLQGTNPWTVNGSVGITSIGNIDIGNVSLPVSIQGNVNVNPITVTGITSNVNVNPITGNVHVYGNVGIDGNVNVNPISVTGITSNVNVNPLSATVSGNISVLNNGNLVSNTNPFPVTGNVNATLSGTPVVSFGGTNLDAFGRLRVSNPHTLFDGAQRYRDDPFKWNQVDTGAATSTFITNESSVLMSVSGNGDESLRQTKSVFAYQPGKSLLTLATFVMTTPTSGLRQRVGLFGAQNGVYFEVDGTTVSMVIRKYTSGSVDDTTEKFSQASWNGDKLNGTGASGITLDVSRAQIFWCDIEWLGVGSVRCGFVIDGQFIVCHTFHHANRVGFNKVYMTSATLPIRYELTSTGAAGTMRAICSTVMSEGGYMNRSITRSIGTSLTGKNLSDTVFRPLVCIRLNAANLESVVVPVKFDVFGLQLAAFSYRIIVNPTLTDASWVSSGADSSVEYDISATALSGGTVVDQGIFVGANKGGSASITSNEVDFSQQIGRTIAGVSDIWCLAAIATTNNDDAVGVVTWQEHI